MSATEIRSLNGYKLNDATARSNIEKLRTESQQYTDTKISQLINSAPTTLDTLGEIAAAMAENATVVEALDAAIGSKADKTYVDEAIANFPAGEPDWNVNDETSPGFIKNRTHWEESEVLLSFNGIYNEEDTIKMGNLTFVRMCDPLPSDNPRFQVYSGTMVTNGQENQTSIITWTVADGVQYCFTYGKTETVLLGYNQTKGGAISPNLPEPGLYFVKESFDEEDYCKEIRLDKIKQIDSKFIPTNIPDWYADSKDPAYIKNRTHYEEVDTYIFNSDYIDHYKSFEDETFVYFKLSDDATSYEALLRSISSSSLTMFGTLIFITGEELQPLQNVVDNHEMGYYYAECGIGPILICIDESLLPEKMKGKVTHGIWLGIDPDILAETLPMGVSIETIIYIVANIKQLDEKFIPDSIMRKDDLTLATEDQLINLLMEIDAFPAMTDKNGSVFTHNDSILLI